MLENAARIIAFHMSKRTDIHRAGAIVPFDYSFVLFYQRDVMEHGEPVPPINIDVVLDMQAKGIPFAKHGGLGRCTVCGARFKIGEVWKHEPTGVHIHIGTDCARKYEMLVDRTEFELQVERAREGARRSARTKANSAERAEFLAAHPGLAEALEACMHPIVCDLAARFQIYRSLSPKQIELALKLHREGQQPLPEKPPEDRTVQAPLGKTEFVGRVVSTRAEDGWHGRTAYKMLVRVDTEHGHWLAWGTIPEKLLMSVEPGQHGRIHTLKGNLVRITARLEPGKDNHFVFMSRPVGRLEMAV